LVKIYYFRNLNYKVVYLNRNSKLTVTAQITSVMSDQGMISQYACFNKEGSYSVTQLWTFT